MKKIYQKPTLSITIVQTTHMVAESLGKYDTGGDGTLLTRQDNSWDIWGEASNDEDWEDDY